MQATSKKSQEKRKIINHNQPHIMNEHMTSRYDRTIERASRISKLQYKDGRMFY